MSSNKPKMFVDRCFISKELLDPYREKYEIIEEECMGLTRSDILSRIEGISAFVCTPRSPRIDADFVKAAGDKLKVVSTCSAGLDHIDVPTVKSLGIKIGYCPNDELIQGVAEHAISLTLMTLMRVKEHVQSLHDDHWRNCIGKAFYGLNGNCLFGKTIGIVGLGRIGTAVAERMRAFRVREILYAGHRENQTNAQKVGARFVTFEELLKNSDVVVVTCSLNDSTRNMFDAKAFAQMKNTSTIINIARGEIIKQDDLISALKSGQIGSAGLDVMVPEPLPTDHELTKLPNVTLTPHMASSATEVRAAMCQLALENAVAGCEGKKLPMEV